MAERSAVILGAGISGVLAARELLSAGWRVTLVEARHVGAGSSSRSAAGIRQQFGTRASVLAMRFAVTAYRELARETEGGAPVMVQNGYLFLYDDPVAWAAAQARARWQQDQGLREVEALATGDLLARFPWASPTCLGGTWCPTDGFLFPTVVMMEGARHVRERGGHILQNAPVTGAHHAGGRLRAVVTPRGTLEADLFLDCTNAWSPRLAALLGGTPLPIAPLKRYIWFLRREGPLTPDAVRAMPLVIAPSGVYGRPESADSLMMGWKHEATPEPEFTWDDQDRVEPAFSHDTGVDARPYEAWARLAEAVPAVGDFAGITATTSGYYATTPDHNPFFGYDPAVPNLIRLAGFSGHGAMFGPFTARVAAALAEAGRDLPEITLPTGVVPLAGFAIGRDLGHPETLVI